MKITKSQYPTVIKALKWAQQKLHPSKPRAWSCRIIEENFGKRKIGQWLRSQLLITTKTNWHFDGYSECKEYCLNEQGYKQVLALVNNPELNIEEKTIQNIADKYQQELTSGDFQYRTQSNRSYHGLQTVRKEIRTPVLIAAGYEYDYDIVCAAPTLLYQRARASGLTEKSMIEQYIANRSLIRQHLSEEYQIELPIIKKFITGLFQGSYISKWHHSHCYRTLNGNYLHIEQLRRDPIIQALQADIRDMWHHIIRDMRLNGEFTEPRVLGKHKAQIYRSIEQEVMREVKRYLNKHKITYFEIHDGFTTREIIDHNELEIYVRNRTRYQINLERQVLTNNNTQTKA